VSYNIGFCLKFSHFAVWFSLAEVFFPTPAPLQFPNIVHPDHLLLFQTVHRVQISSVVLIGMGCGSHCQKTDDGRPTRFPLGILIFIVGFHHIPFSPPALCHPPLLMGFWSYKCNCFWFVLDYRRSTNDSCWPSYWNISSWWYYWRDDVSCCTTLITFWRYYDVLVCDATSTAATFFVTVAVATFVAATWISILTHAIIATLNATIFNPLFLL